MERTILADDLEICRILNGMWQVAGSHGQIDPESAVTDMEKYQESGFTTWDLADIYGPAESLIGKFRRSMGADEKFQALTKFVPNPGPMSNSIVTHYIEQSLQKMDTDCIDLLQFHWWDYNNASYLDALSHLSKLQNEQKIRHIGLTNFDTERVRIIIEGGFEIVSNQVQYSILDQRPEKLMVPFFAKHGIKILSYGTLLGGFFSEKYLGADEPHRGALLDGFSMYREDGAFCAPYTPVLFDEFEKRFGYDLKERLPDLFLLVDGKRISQVKWHYVELLQQLFLENFAIPCKEWCEQHNVDYIIGIAKNKRLQETASSLINKAQKDFSFD